MVKVSVKEQSEKAAYIEDEDDYITDEEGSIVGDPDDVELAADDDEDEDEDLALTAFRPEDETIGDRIAALKDILSPSTRARLSRFTSSVTSYAYFGGKIGGRLAWVGMTSALLVGLPLALTIENEGMLVQQEKEYYQQQQGQQQLIGAPAASGQPGPQGGIVPPGF